MTVKSDSYILGHTSAEYQRLRRQAQLWEEPTARLFHKAGVKPGMSCLDIGCGPGEVMRVMGDIVGPAGSVTGLDMDGDLGRETLAILQGQGNSNFEFYEANVETADTVPGAPFDVTYARWLLLHVKDPVSVLQKMKKWTKPGGIIIVQEYDVEDCEAYPDHKETNIVKETFISAANTLGMDYRIGLRMPTYFDLAGLGKPDGIDIGGMMVRYDIAGPYIQTIYENIFPAAQKLGLANEHRKQEITHAMKTAMEEDKHFFRMPPLIGMWNKSTH